MLAGVGCENQTREQLRAVSPVTGTMPWGESKLGVLSPLGKLHLLAPRPRSSSVPKGKDRISIGKRSCQFPRTNLTSLVTALSLRVTFAFSFFFSLLISQSFLETFPQYEWSILISRCYLKIFRYFNKFFFLKEERKNLKCWEFENFTFSRYIVSPFPSIFFYFSDPSTRSLP